MSGALRWQLVPVLLLTTTLLALPADAQGQQPGTLSFVGPGTEAQTLLLDKSDAGVRSGQLDVLLTNESDQTITPNMEYVLTGSGRVMEVTSTEPATSPSPDDPVRVYLVEDPPDIGSFETKKLSFSVSVAAGTRPAVAAGKLVARAPGQKIKPATMTVNPVLSPPWSWQGAVVEPAAITINHTNRVPRLLASVARWVGVSDDDGKTVTVRGISADTLGSANQGAILSSSTGGTAKVVLDPKQNPASPATGILRVEQISGVGKYEGNLLLDPEASNSPKLAVTVNARDFILWPLLTLIAGVLVAWAALWYRETHRPKELLLSRIKEIHKANEQNIPDEEEPAPLYRYDKLFPEDRSDYQGGWFRCKVPENSPWAKRLYCEVIASHSKEEFEDLQKQVNDLAARVDLWRPTYDATKTLHLACTTARDVVCDPEDTLVSDPENIPLLQETGELLKPGKKYRMPLRRKPCSAS